MSHYSAVRCLRPCQRRSVRQKVKLEVQRQSLVVQFQEFCFHTADSPRGSTVHSARLQVNVVAVWTLMALIFLYTVHSLRHIGKMRKSWISLSPSHTRPPLLHLHEARDREHADFPQFSHCCCASVPHWQRVQWKKKGERTSRLHSLYIPKPAEQTLRFPSTFRTYVAAKVLHWRQGWP